MIDFEVDDIRVDTYPTHPRSLMTSDESMEVANAILRSIVGKSGNYITSSGLSFPVRICSVKNVRIGLPSQAILVTCKTKTRGAGLNFHLEFPNSGINVPGLSSERNGEGKFSIMIRPFSSRERLEIPE